MGDWDWQDELGDADQEIRTIRTRLAAVEAERDRLAERLKFTHAVFACGNVTKGPVHREPDDAFRPDGPVFRIVRDEDARRFREDYQTTARPSYVATVYSADDAMFVEWAWNNLENWLRHYTATEADRDTWKARAEAAEADLADLRRTIATAREGHGDPLAAAVFAEEARKTRRATAEEIAAWVRAEFEATGLADMILAKWRGKEGK